MDIFQKPLQSNLYFLFKSIDSRLETKSSPEQKMRYFLRKATHGMIDHISSFTIRIL